MNRPPTTHNPLISEPYTPSQTARSVEVLAPTIFKVRSSDLAQYCQLCGKVAEVTLRPDFTHAIVNLSTIQLPVAVRKSSEPDQGSGTPFRFFNVECTQCVVLFICLVTCPPTFRVDT